MTQDLLTLLRGVDPAAGPSGGEYDARDRAILALATATANRPPARRRRATWIAAVLATAAALVGLGLVVVPGPGSDFNAAARVYQALAPGSGIYHFVSTSRFERSTDPKAEGMKPPFALPYFYEPGQSSADAEDQYEEDWVTLDGTRIKWVKFDTRNGRPSEPRAAASFTQPLGRSEAPTDPASSFRRAYQQGDVRSGGAVQYEGQPAWRFDAVTGTRREDWIVDRKTWLPLRYEYVQQGNVPTTMTLDVRFVKFEVLPLTAETKKLFALTAQEQRVQVR
jgi:hypothetical protein